MLRVLRSSLAVANKATCESRSDRFQDRIKPVRYIPSAEKINGLVKASVVTGGVRNDHNLGAPVDRLLSIGRVDGKY